MADQYDFEQERSVLTPADLDAGYVSIGGEQDAPQEEATDYLELAKQTFEKSTSYFDANIRKRLETNIALFQSRHPTDSKYNSEAYKHRSRLFRPKTRSIVRKNEAAAAAAFFSNVDVVSIEAENSADKLQQASSEVNQVILNYRLQKTIPWFKLLLGALQDAQVNGVVASYQYWKYSEVEEQQAQVVEGADEYGNPVQYEEVVTVPRVIEDKPCVELIAPENIRFDPGADWLDPVNSSPYIIRLVPMYAVDVKKKMRSIDSKTGQPQWKPLSDGEIRAAMGKYGADTLRQARENTKSDPKAEGEAPLMDYEIIWCHENILRREEGDVLFWTLGCEHLLSDPVPLESVYHTGERPFVIGVCTIETHKAIPAALVELGEPLQKEANEIVNQRLDNVKLVLNKRFFAKRGAQVDVQSLLRNVPGGVTLMNNLDDVLPVDYKDVTSSAYAEQDRINVDMDELLGNFSAGSVMTNRKMNETVGGMGLLSSGSSQMTEYLLRTFVETWVEPVLRQLVKLEQMYESDPVILALAGEGAQIQKYGMDEVTDELLNQDLTVRVNVGMGATDPTTKLQKFTMAAGTFAQVAQIPGIDQEAARKEIFGLAGYRDGGRFFQSDEKMTPAERQLMEQLEKAMGMIEQMGAKMQALEAGNEAKIMEARAKMAQAAVDQDKAVVEGAQVQLQAQALVGVGAPIAPGVIETNGPEDVQHLLAGEPVDPPLYGDPEGDEAFAAAPEDPAMQPGPMEG
jgi:hypothetical protein